ncbi:MAG: MarR family winged helix-turn-helix transcriptional regulator [Micrococcus sp.]|nr:MarR family winged helix-turn-helix transcriptional regulator [Micrococcus sp.]
MTEPGQATLARPDDGSLGRDTADKMLTALQAFERVVRWGFRSHQHPDDPGPAAQATLFFLQRHQPVRAKDIADWLGIGAAPMSRQLADLEAQGLVVRTPDPDDARAALTSLTAAGQDAVRDLRDRRVTVLQQALSGLDEAEARRFITTMGRVLEEFRHGLDSMGKEGRP